jgi:hypothetical protein
MKRPVLTAVIIAIVFGAAFAAFGLIAPHLWNSPDETAVAFFADYFRTHDRLWTIEAYNIFGTGVVHPRSILALDMGYLVPASFYGAIYFFGMLMRFAGVSALAWGTPLATALASLCVFLAFRKIFDPRRALFAQVLFLADPAVWYFSSRGLFPNMLFLDLAAIGLAVLYLRPWQSLAKGRGIVWLEMMIDDLAGFFIIGFAFLVRPVEIIWLAPLLIAMLWFSRKSLNAVRIIAGVLIAAAFAGVFGYENLTLYGGILNSGYTAGSLTPGVAAPAIGVASRLPAFLSSPRAFILPFGFHPHAALVNMWTYMVAFAWWLPALAAVGFFLTKDRAARRRLSRIFWWTAAVVGIYYGSGIFVDSSVSQWTVGSSYLRYFLPASIMLVPLAAEGVSRMSAARRYVAPLVIGIFIVLSAWTVYYRSPESLVPMLATLRNYETIKTAVLKEVKPESIIITERDDKVFFPDRRVVIGLRDKAVLDQLPSLEPHGLYYYGITIKESELPTINKELGARNLQLGHYKTFGNESLYGITKIPK